MKIILDESAPQKLRLLIDNRHLVGTTWFQGWSGLKNGALLAAAEEAGFELFITADEEISHQQNLAGHRIALLVLSTNHPDKVAGLVQAFDMPTIRPQSRHRRLLNARSRPYRMLLGRAANVHPYRPSYSRQLFAPP